MQNWFLEYVLRTDSGELIFMKNGTNRENICHQASKRKDFEASYGDSKNELQLLLKMNKERYVQFEEDQGSN